MHSYNQIWIHAIWATKDRQPFVTSRIEKAVFNFMRKQFEESGCPVRIINGMPDHVHCLFLLNPKKSVAEVIKQIKGSTSHFINQSNFIEERFSWQTGYACFSVSESVVDKTFRYIRNQKQHHAKKTFQEEYNAFLDLYGLNKNG
ncbi:MAG: IS200/IS605 family transposase [Flavobacteriales bacterium]|nr:IS200/IS605 family transposase [Flavobacteriales bacterium]